MNLKWNQMALAFLIGALLGSMIGASRLRPHIFKRWGKEPRQERLLERFSSKLDLSAEQREKVKGILESGRTKMDALFSEMRPKFEQVRKETSMEIKKILNPDQQKKFEVLDGEMEKNSQKRFHGRPQ